MPRPNKCLPTKHATHLRYTTQIKRNVSRTDKTRLPTLAAPQGHAAMRQASLGRKSLTEQQQPHTENAP